MRAESRIRPILLLAMTGLSGQTSAHHSTITYDTSQQVQFSGVVRGWTVGNPHAHLTVVETRADGSTVAHRCESYSVAALQRLGFDARSFAIGDLVSVTAAPSRVNAEECLLQGVQRDGRAMNFVAGGPPAAASTLNMSMFGTWAPMRAVSLSGPPGIVTAAGPGGFKFRAVPDPVLDRETAAGAQADAGYRPLHDDPAYACKPVGLLRVWHEPDTVLAIRREGDHVLLDFEFMDVKRIVHLQPAPPANVRASELGFSVGHFDGEDLVIETTHFTPGVISQYALDAQGKLHGVLHSDQYQVNERIHLDRASNVLEVQFSHADPKYYQAPLRSETLHFGTSARPDFAPYHCEKARPPD